MNKIPSSKAALTKWIDKVSSTKDWKMLDLIEDVPSVENLNTNDKERLAQLFAERGEMLVQTTQDAEDLLEAVNSFEKALRIDPTLSKAWIALATTHFKLGTLQQDEQLIAKANEIYDHAQAVLHAQSLKLPLEALWGWGTCLYSIAKLSEEAVDFKNCLQKFQEASARGYNDPEFLLDYGTLLGEFGVLVGRQEFLIQSTETLERSLKEKNDSPIAWLRLGCAYKILFLLSEDIAFFEKAEHCFMSAARNQQNHMILWLNWGQLLAHIGKATRDLDLLKSALEKLEKAELIQPKDPFLLSSTADTLMHIGVLEENYENLQTAKEKLQLALSMAPEQPEIINHMGHCLLYIARYFNDASYVEEAIEKFQMGVSRNKNAFPFWHGLATAHFLLGEINGDVKEFEKAAKFCSQVIRLGGTSSSFWNDWGVALMKLGELSNDHHAMSAAIEKFEEAINSYNRSRIGRPDPDWFYNYGCALDYLAEFELNPRYSERSIAVLSRLLEQYPNFNHVRYNLALSLYHYGDMIGDADALEKSIELFGELVVKEPEDDTLHSDYGLSCLTLADYLRDSIHDERSKECFKLAEQHFFHAISLGNESANFYLACLYSLLGNYTEAMQFITRAHTAEALPVLDDLLRDEWLENLRQTPRFRAFLTELSDE